MRLHGRIADVELLCDSPFERPRAISRKTSRVVLGTKPLAPAFNASYGLAAAILIDATIVRGVLLPATMKLLGEWNW